MSTTRELVWLITGTSSGFGRRLVQAAIKRGDCVIAASRSLEKLQTLHTESDKLKLLELDVTSGFEVIKEIIDKAVGFWGRIDVLINNAGTGYLGLFEEGGSALVRRQFETNVFAVVDVTNAVLPHMRRRAQGTIITVASRSIWRAATPGLGTYAASKAAIHALTEALAVEVAQWGIRVSILSPGAFRTEGMYGIPFHTSNQILEYDVLRRKTMDMYSRIPGSEPGNPERAMDAVVDVVRGEGIAEGRPWPACLLLGIDAERDLIGYCDRHKEGLEKWGDVSRNMGF